MIAVIYRGFIYPESEEEYLKLWTQIANYFVQHRGALGSCLHKTEDNEYIAYSRWPDRKTRETSWGSDDATNQLPIEIQAVIKKLKDCIDLSKPHDEICMDVTQDLLSNSNIHA